MKILLHGNGGHYKEIICYFTDKGYYVNIDADQKSSRPHYDIMITPKNWNIQKESMEKVWKTPSYFSEMHKAVTDSVIADLFSHTDLVERPLSIVILGYNTIGKRLTYALTSLGHLTYVQVDNEEDKTLLDTYGVTNFYPTDREVMSYLKYADIIINTKQENFLTEEHVESLKEHTYILDLFKGTCFPEEQFFTERNISYKKIYADLSDEVETFEPEKTLMIHLHQPYSNNI